MKTRISIVGLLLVAWVSAPSMAALNGYLAIKGQIQGDIKGSVTQKGREGQIAVYGFTHMFNTLPDIKTCLAGDIRSHSPLTIIKEFDQSTPGLMRAWIGREPLTVTFRLWRPLATGAEEQYFTIILEGALISGIQQESFNNKDASLLSFPTMERISFTYEKMSESWNPNGDSVMDIWTAQCNRTGVISDLNFDGVVNILDFAILADQWLMQSY
jgi:type VI secretion system secreted protein Hcp